jgi:hypothetical protein
MSIFKNNPNFNLYYSDTDSIDIDKPLSDKDVGTELGKMKLERIFKKIVYLAPKVYGGITTDNKQYIKIKGLTKIKDLIKKNLINFNELTSLLNKDTILEVPNNKWYKNLNESNIIIKKDIYTFIITDNKRKLIYKDNKFIDTKPIIINYNNIIIIIFYLYSNMCKYYL